jgi:hypothetical protein
LHDILKIIAQYPSFFTVIDATRITKNQSIHQQGGKRLILWFFARLPLKIHNTQPLTSPTVVPYQQEEKASRGFAEKAVVRIHYNNLFGFVLPSAKCAGRIKRLHRQEVNRKETVSRYETQEKQERNVQGAIRSNRL